MERCYLRRGDSLSKQFAKTKVLKTLMHARSVVGDVNLKSNTIEGMHVSLYHYMSG